MKKLNKDWNIFNIIMIMIFFLTILFYLNAWFGWIFKPKNTYDDRSCPPYCSEEEPNEVSM